MIAPDIIRSVWARWNELPDDCPAPVKTIAADLRMPAAVVASIVYPAETFGAWSDDQEPDEPHVWSTRTIDGVKIR